MTFAEKLKQLRKDAGVSQLKMHLDTGISNSLIQSYERGTVLPFEKNTNKISIYFNINFNTLMREIDKERLLKNANSR